MYRKEALEFFKGLEAYLTHVSHPKIGIWGHNYLQLLVLKVVLDSILWYV
jgi:hypothetical protein